MSVVRLEKNISIGNLVSWAMILCGLVATYVTLQDSVSAATKTANDAKERAETAQAQIYDLRTNIAVIKNTVEHIDEKVDEIRNKTNQTNK